ncbi:BREX-1 system adenine-specific DNA-methyltransferase PglX [Mycobacterium interjectum]|uniref:BREX-1 system adenine-specific DNA-methyltransferase PglX n=1 Tax=Mycobacterium interjectum TaxID=33895 RepID=UPI00083497F7|nr:BREX-1 system adenine-specific DNA-methyltransferase PglX [Mycobacterium interjectum]MCV7092678.1 BREX-1 system adenine-specific DNA-methyltransferase PglX [Mycobacterium interjectum]
METAPLKSFAVWARTALIREVTARIAVVLAPASPERVEQPKAVAALEKAVIAAGGGDRGRAAVADRVAYTWFNRIIALRFMDANGYTGIGVVSPQAGVDVGQPEVLAEAKRGNIDAEVVSKKRSESVTGLLNGTRRSDDPQGEAYALLLTEYCRHWNRAMPFMFEREGDFTELLIPANLLADDSVLNRAINVLSEDVCQDVEVIGWLYQFYIIELKEQINDSKVPIGADNLAPVTQLFTPHWIVRYLVENSLGRLWLRSRPSSRLRDRMEYYVEPLAGQQDTGIVVSSPEQIRVVDPACGSAHMLTYAFDLLYAIYEEEGYTPSSISELILTHNLRGLEVDDRAAQLASFALAMKARGRDRRFLQRRIQPDIIWIRPITFEPTSVQRIVETVTTQPRADGSPADAEAVSRLLYSFVDANYFGSLIRVNAAALAALDNALDTLEANAADLYATNDAIQARDLVRQAKALVDQQYNVVIANPPYLAARNMAPKLKNWVETNYAGAKNDLLAAFMVRATEVSVQSGQWGMIVLPSWMFLSTFAAFREWFLDSQRIESFLHLGRGIFGSDFGSDAFSVTNAPAPDGYRATYRRLFDEHVQVRKPEVIERLFRDPEYHHFETKQSDYKLIPDAPIAYWLSSAMKNAFAKGVRLADIASPRQGLATADNNRFLRQWFEVCESRIGFGMKSRQQAKESGKKWFPYNKGGPFRRWWGNQDYVVNWEDDGKDLWDFRPRSVIRNPNFYFRRSISWSDVSSGLTPFRMFPDGFVYDVSGMSLFPSEPARNGVQGFLNSSVCPKFLAIVSPTIHAQIGDVGKIPIVPADSSVVGPLVDELVSTFRCDWDLFETSWDFGVNPLVAFGAGALEAHAKTRWDNAVATTKRAQELEEENNQYFARLYGLEDEVECMVPLSRVSLTQNPYFRYAPTRGVERSEEDYRTLFFSDLAKELVSYAVGCMMGRYSLDAPGLILADEGATLQDYLANVSSPTFMPDKDNVIPIVDGDWFEDDMVARFRQFLRAAFGEQHFEENLRFVTESLGVKDLRDYFVKSFYKDHVQRYKKRPIYWLFSSPKGSFNALIYVHRYTPSTVSTVLNEYLREFKAKLRSSLEHQERLVAAGGGTPRQQAAAQKETDRLRKVLLELDEYEHDVLYPLASHQIEIDLDDGVKVNYPKFGAALKKIPGLEASE